MNRISFLSWCCAVSFLLFDRQAQAESPMGMPVSIRPLVELALKDPVLKELGIPSDAPVVADMRKLSQRIRKELPQRLRSPKQEGGGEGNRVPPAVQAAKIQAEFNIDLSKLLTADQYTRLRQIHWQRSGLSALHDPEIVNALAISQEQRKKLDAVQRESFGKQREILNSGPDIEEITKKAAALVADWETEVNKVLSPAQQEKFAKLESEEEFSLRDLTKAEMVKALDLTQDQQDKLAKLSQDAIDKQAKLFESVNGKRNRRVDENSQEKLRELTAEQQKKSTEILTADQQRKFAELKGKSFDTDALHK